MKTGVNDAFTLYSGIALVSDPSDKEDGNVHRYPKHHVLSHRSHRALARAKRQKWVSLQTIKAIAIDASLKQPLPAKDFSLSSQIHPGSSPP